MCFGQERSPPLPICWISKWGDVALALVTGDCGLEEVAAHPATNHNSHQLCVLAAVVWAVVHHQTPVMSSGVVEAM
jgi:hypothetical protein